MIRVLRADHQDIGELAGGKELAVGGERAQAGILGKLAHALEAIGDRVGGGDHAVAIRHGGSEGAVDLDT